VKPAAQPKTGGTLRTTGANDLTTANGHFNQGSARQTLWLTYDHLTAYDDKFQPQPVLAESWDISNDLKQFKLNLRKGVTWHSGREFTSADVKSNILAVRDPTTAGTSFVAQSNWFTTIDTPDKYTVILKSEQPRPAVFDFFEYFNIIDVDEQPQGGVGKTPVGGTGPFTFVEWAQGDHLTFAKNKNYWQSGRPYLDTVVYTIMKDPAAQTVALEAGAMEVVENPSLRDFARYQTDPKYQAILHPISGQFLMNAFNCTVQPFDNKLVRQALTYALDRKRIAETVLLGTSAPTALPWPPSSPAYDTAKMNSYAFDLDRAKSLLSQAGVSNVTADFYPSPSAAELQPIAQIYQADLAKIGVTLNIVNVAFAEFLNLVNNRNYRGLHSTTNSYAQLEPITLVTSSQSFSPAVNNSGFKSESYAQLIAQAGAEPDPVKRKQFYATLNDVLLDESFTQQMVYFPSRLATRAAVHDIGYTVHQAFTYTNTWIE
jgi:peptide/nickel transport system substrate-binding protein